MEMEGIHHENACKMSRVGNKIGLLGSGEQYQDDDDDDGGDHDHDHDQDQEQNQKAAAAAAAAATAAESNRLRAWHSSRIFRVSRASGGKDRHSKVLTAKGLRDRRVRLSVSTAIQFYDLQDRLGYDQPSKAVEWLIKAAADAIAELPSLDTKFPETPTDEDKRGSSSKALIAVELENDPSFQQHCSSTSETSKGSVLSLSRSENRVKARERARERAAKDKDKEQIEEADVGHQHNSHNSSFTELLTSGAAANNHSPHQSSQQNHSSPVFFLKPIRQSPPTSMDYFTSGLFGAAASSRNHFSSGFSSQSPFVNTMTPFNVSSDHHPQHPQHPQHQHHHQHHQQQQHQPELQQFAFLPDQLIPGAQPVTGSDYNLNFSISSGFAGYNRGTLQSNSPSQLPPQFQRFSSPSDGSNIPFYIGNAAASNATPTPGNQFPPGFDGRLQLYYGDGSRHSDSKGKEKS